MFRIRKASRPDSAALLQLIRQYYKFDSIDFHAATVGRALGRLLKNPRLGRVWVIDNGKKLLGYAIMTYNYDLEFGGVEGIVTELFVASRYRDHGLGAQLIDEIRRFCVKVGISTVELQVSRDNHRARAFYRKHGFKALDRVVMSLEINC